MKLNTIRKSFLDFFSKNGHKIIESSSLIPHQDPSLMFTNSGMVQFKNYFTGAQTPEFKKAVTAQKCVRAGGKHNDLDNVGYTARHHTFFEMLGNFSFGDYFKAEAIELAWSYITKDLSISKEKLYITIYHEDLEAYDIWHKITGFGDDRIIKIKTNDNFWSMGDLGPCGPCSEIFYDHGDQYFGGLPGTPDADGDRYIEIWNLVFMQYEQLENGTRKNLPKPSIDTGMGIERIAAVLQGQNDNYEIDLFIALINKIKELTGDKETLASHKVIADHLRAACFLIASGISPSNEGRGYVLRRIMRRAMRHVHQLGYKDAMMHHLVPTLINEMGEAYHELQNAKSFISSTLQIEEERFKETLERGIKLLNSNISEIKPCGILSGEVAFKLYDTYGFPLDLTKDILRSHQIILDETSFEQCMREQKNRARAAWVGSGETSYDAIWYQIYEEYGQTEFIGYNIDTSQAKILAILQNGEMIKQATSGEVIVVVNQTPFYAESGGQIGDTGYLGNHKVNDTQKYLGKIFGHHITISQGNTLSIGEQVTLTIDKKRRLNIKANHSATHLLHLALRHILGDHVVQKGSIVTDTKLRFDFSHSSPLTHAELISIEELVNEMIISNFDVNTEIMQHSQAISKGAMALFGEKYEDQVRVISIGGSIELCGGTHVTRSGDIGLFKIMTDSSIASGIRRIEAITGIHALKLLNQKCSILKDITSDLKCTEQDLMTKIHSIINEKKEFEKQLKAIQLQNLGKIEVKEHAINSKNYYIIEALNIEMKDMKYIADLKKNTLKDGIIIILSASHEKNHILIQIGAELQSKENANELLKRMSHYINIKGGGNQNLAQAISMEQIESAILIQILQKISL